MTKTNLLSECIFFKNFAYVGHKVLIRNESSHTLLTKSELIFIKELKENGLILEVPLNVCQKGHNLTLFFLNSDSVVGTKLPDFGRFKEAQFEAMAKVESIERNESKEATVIIDVYFTQYDIEGWKKILNEYVKNQEEINKTITNQHVIRDEE